MNTSHRVWSIHQLSSWWVRSSILASHSDLCLSSYLMAETFQIMQWRWCSSMNIQSANASGLLNPCSTHESPQTCHGLSVLFFYKLLSLSWSSKCPCPVSLTYSPLLAPFVLCRRRMLTRVSFSELFTPPGTVASYLVAQLRAPRLGAAQ